MSEESTTPDLVELTRQGLDAFNRRDLDAQMSFYAPDAGEGSTRRGALGVLPVRDEPPEARFRRSPARERFGTDTVTAGGGDASLGRKAATWIEGFLVRAAGPVLASHSSARDRSEREGRCS
jgi:hypothetical protein